MRIVNRGKNDAAGPPPSSSVSLRYLFVQSNAVRYYVMSFGVMCLFEETSVLQSVLSI